MFREDYRQYFPKECPTFQAAGQLVNLDFGDKYEGIALNLTKIPKVLKFMTDNYGKQKTLIDLSVADIATLNEFHTDLSEYLKTTFPDQTFDVRAPFANQVNIRVQWPVRNKERVEQSVVLITPSHVTPSETLLDTPAKSSQVTNFPPMTQQITREQFNEKLQSQVLKPTQAVVGCKLWARGEANADPSLPLVTVVGMCFTLREIRFE